MRGRGDQGIQDVMSSPSHSPVFINALWDGEDVVPVHEKIFMCIGPHLIQQHHEASNTIVHIDQLKRSRGEF